MKVAAEVKPVIRVVSPRLANSGDISFFKKEVELVHEEKAVPKCEREKFNQPGPVNNIKI